MHTCIQCNVVINNINKFCSHRCRRLSDRQVYIDKWLKGKETGYMKDNYRLSGHVRNFLLEEANYKCTQCGWSEINPISERVPLHIDHKDGNAANCSRSNLKVICPNCHSLTPNYGALNIGNSVRKY